MTSSISSSFFKIFFSSALVVIILLIPPFFIIIRLSAINANVGSCVAINTILSEETSNSKAFFLSIPAFSISSIKTIGDELKIAVSAIIKARDCPPLKAVIAVVKSNCSPASLFAALMISSTVSSMFSIIRLCACSSRNSFTDKSITKFIFWDNCATNLLFEE